MKPLVEYLKTNKLNLIAVALVFILTTFFPDQVANVLAVCEQVKVDTAAPVQE